MRICIVDDNTSFNEVIKVFFEDKGYDVDCFDDSTEAEKHILLHHADYDLLILDWMMPEKTGLDICKKLRKNNILTPILILTAVNVLNNKIDALDEGADDYLLKPFLIPELLARVRALLRRRQETKPNIITEGTEN